MSEDKIIAEYIWVDKFNKLRSKSKVLQKKYDNNINSLPLWNYDGSSTDQADVCDSEITLKPCNVFKDPFRSKDNILVLCETFNPDNSPCKSNYRYKANEIFNKNKNSEPWFGLEQEYFINTPMNNHPIGYVGEENTPPQGNYYCGVGTTSIFGRNIVDEHLTACLFAGVNISGMNAEDGPSQWEYQIGPCEGIEAGDHLWIARYILERITELCKTYVCYDPKPLKGNWSGSGCHVNFSTKQMRNDNFLLIENKYVPIIIPINAP